MNKDVRGPEVQTTKRPWRTQGRLGGLWNDWGGVLSIPLAQKLLGVDRLFWMIWDDLLLWMIWRLTSVAFEL